MPKITPADHSQPEAAGQERAEERGRAALDDRAWHRNPTHRQQFVEMELQADAEHQQDDADLRQLFRQRRIGHEARRVRPDQHAGQQIAHDRRKAQALGDVAKHERGAEAAREGQDELVTVHVACQVTNCHQETARPPDPAATAGP